MSKKQTDIRNWFSVEKEKKKKMLLRLNLNFSLRLDHEIMVFTDGSAINNGSKNAKGGVGVFFR